MSAASLLANSSENRASMLMRLSVAAGVPNAPESEHSTGTCLGPNRPSVLRQRYSASRHRAIAAHRVARPRSTAGAKRSIALGSSASYTRLPRLSWLSDLAVIAVGNCRCLGCVAGHRKLLDRTRLSLGGGAAPSTRRAAGPATSIAGYVLVARRWRRGGGCGRPRELPQLQCHFTNGTDTTSRRESSCRIRRGRFSTAKTWAHRACQRADPYF
jgi:hypothetical protein